MPLIKDNTIKTWTAFTPTGTWTTNCTYTGFKRQIGENMEYQIKVSITGGAPGVGGSLSINLPDTIDTTKMVDTEHFLGSRALLNDSSATYYYGAVTYNTTTSIYILKYTVSGANLVTSVVSDTSPFSFGVSGTDEITATFSVPIVGLTA